ncbi:hypothetical protein [Parasphingorhabdus halotolerans]|uniref:Uncharacterized protein n=1 Tax=Parasphingorhabdus halotolerans TaxID=2725558 RepID=A0A6H2DL14_9SPHN|nr:hypothetical protein [Parasphingorhabdus halotolerans]QJB68645.1 hypothetical protein HF685_04565 [Parasphingorhabdus halotolerans]
MGHAKVYDLRNRPGAEEFAAAWDDAIAKATDQVHHVLVDHAVNGAVEPIMFGGVQVGEFRRYNYRMMMWLLRHHKPEQFNPRQDAQGSDAPALSDQQMKALKAEWRAEWEAERAAKDKVQMEEFLAAQEKRKAEHQADFHAKIETMRTRMIANYERGDRAGGQNDGQTDGQNDGQTGDRASQQKSALIRRGRA